MTLPIVGELVWLKVAQPRKSGPGVVAQKWTAGTPTGDRVVLARHPLNADQMAMSIAILEQRFPPPVEIVT